MPSMVNLPQDYVLFIIVLMTVKWIKNKRIKLLVLFKIIFRNMLKML
jgi:hypothetical protein